MKSLLSKFVGIAVLSCIVAVVGANSHGMNDAIRIGVLEDIFVGSRTILGHYTPAHYVTKVRTVFQYDGGDWTAFAHEIHDARGLEQNRESFLVQERWFAIVGGKVKGELTSEPADRYEGHLDACTQPVLHAPEWWNSIPRSLNWSGWRGKPVRQPIVLVSQVCAPQIAYKKEPWSGGIPDKVLDAFVDNVPVHRREGGDWALLSSETLRGMGEIEVRDCYGWMAEHRLFSVGFRENSRFYDDNVYAAELRDHWIVQLGESVRYIGTHMELLTMGDFDCDSAVDAMFWIDGYNRNGYKLFWDSFSQEETYDWKYH